MTSASVSVLIVNWNTSDLLRSCLTSLRSLPEAAELETVVIDNGSADGSADMVAGCFPEVRLLRNETNAGFARANNQGFRRSMAPHVLLLNSDTQVGPGVITACRDHLRDHAEVGVVGCRIANADGTPQNSIFRFPGLWGVVSTAFGLARLRPTSPLLNRDRYGLLCPDRLISVEVVMGSFFMVRRSDIEGDLLDDGYFMYTEEADLCRRMRERGLRVDHLPVGPVVHLRGASSRTPEQRAWSEEAKKRAQLRYLDKWHGPVTAWLANAVLLVGALPRLVVWAGRDAVDRALGRPGGRLHRARVLRFHLAALLRPSRCRERFHGPPV